MTRYRALDKFELRVKKYSGAEEKRTYEKGQLVGIPEAFERDDEYMQRVNASRTVANKGIAFKVPYIETYVDQDGERVEEEFHKHEILPVAETQLKADEEE